MVARSRPSPTPASATVDVRVFETQADELAWLAGAVEQAHDRPAWSDIGVLARDNGTAEAVYDALRRRDAGRDRRALRLLRLPEVAEVVAMLELLHDLTANAALLTLLTGPRWASGRATCALLGQPCGRAGRAPGACAERRRPRRSSWPRSPTASTPPSCRPSPTRSTTPVRRRTPQEARERFALLAAELRRLRALAGEPILDVVRRIVDVTGIDIELASAVGPQPPRAATTSTCSSRPWPSSRPIDGDVTLPALLAYLPPRTTRATASTSPPPPRPTRSSC